MKFISNFFFLAFCFVFTYQLTAQGEANNWYFGQSAGVSFNTSPPMPLTDGQMITNEGSSSISDASGRLLFYTDGRSVWDREHNIMPNADYFGGSGLLGDIASTQTALIIPYPDQPELYYIFTVDQPHHQNANAYPNQGPADANGFPLEVYDQRAGATVPEVDDGFNNGVNYSIVDMSLRNGLGDVVQDAKNIHLITYDENNSEHVKFKSSEKITAVAGPDCNSVWVITHFVRSFYAFLIDEDGINEVPVISSLSPTIGLEYYVGSASGYLKASPDGKKLSMATTQTLPPIAISGNLQLYDFDNQTGEVSNPLTLSSNSRPYGVAFSPDSKKVYASIASDLVQWDLTAGNIPASAFTLNTGSFQAALQLAPNGKIYASGGTDLNVINNPNQFGEAIEYSNSTLSGAIDLGGNSTSLGLPAFVQSIYNTRVDIISGEAQNSDFKIETAVSVCDGATYTLGFEYEEGATYQWYENGQTIPNQTSPFLEVGLVNDEEVPFETAYTLEIFPESGECKLSGIANVVFAENPNTTSALLTQCVTNFENETAFFNIENAREDLVAETNLSAENFEFIFYESEQDLANDLPITDTNNFQNSTNPQTLFVKVKNINTRCHSISTVELQVDDIAGFEEVELFECDTNLDGFQQFNLNFTADETDLIPTHFYTSINDALRDENRITNTTSYPNTEAYEQTIYFRTQSDVGCGILGILNLKVRDLPFLFNDKEFFYCIEDTPNTIKISPDVPVNSINEYVYFWPSTNEETLEIEVNEAGTYQVLVTEIATGCESIQTIFVTNSSLADYQVNVDDGSEVSNNFSIQINPESSLGDYEFAVNNPNGPFQDNPNFNNLAPGFYEVYVRDKNGCGIKKITTGLIGIMQFFTPNSDGVNDTWNVLGLKSNKNAKVRIFDRYGKLLKQFNAQNSAGWDGTYNGKIMPNNDYWYHVELDDGRVLKGNFTLKR